MKVRLSQLRYHLILYFLLGYGTYAHAFEPFTVQDIRLENLRRIAAGTVFNYLPVKVGDRFDEVVASRAINALFKTGLFKDVRIKRESTVLIVEVEELPAIYKIIFSGNSDIGTEELKNALKNVGFAEGRVFNRSLLEKVELELQKQYFNLGKYAVQIQSTVTPLDRNRVNIQINISEGTITRIRQIQFVGNHDFKDGELLDEMELNTGGWFSFFTKSDQYSRQKLSADLEAIRSFYLDRGYINFNIESTQVSITPDKKLVYITINLSEGHQYKVSDVKLAGNPIVDKKELLEKITIKTGDVFSRKESTASSEALQERIGDEGYAFASINVVPEIDNDKKTVALSFFIDPGKRVTVRRINFYGNTRTRDEVLRREMRQMEGGWLSTKHLKRSQERLQRLGYFDDIKIETPTISDAADEVDVNVSVVERPSGMITAGIGYGQTQGLTFNANFEIDNFLGSGKRIGVGFNNSQINTVYEFSYLNPYTDIDGVSRGFTVFYRTTDAEQANLSRYTTDTFGGRLNYGIPISEFNRVYFGGEFENIQLHTTTNSAQEVFDFIRDEGDEYKIYRLTTSWAYDSRNHQLLPSKGMLQSVGAEIALPVSDLDYYKIFYRHQWFYPLTKSYTFAFKGDIGYGNGYGTQENLPFFEHYTAGGPRTVRGYKENTLGPLDSRGLPFGGNLRVVGTGEILLPIPFTKDVRNFRLSTFVDGGNVYGTNEKFDASQLRYSTGLAAIWLAPVGVFSFSLAKPLNKKMGDQTQVFQFSIGTTF